MYSVSRRTQSSTRYVPVLWQNTRVAKRDRRLVHLWYISTMTEQCGGVGVFSGPHHEGVGKYTPTFIRTQL